MTNLIRCLWGAVAALGVGGGLTDVVAGSAPGYAVRIAVLAGLVATVELLPGQGGRGWLAVVLAVAGALDAAGAWLIAEQGGWVTAVTLCLNGLQSIIAVAALLAEWRHRSPVSGIDAAYATYLEYVQAYYNAAQFPQPSYSTPSADHGAGADEGHDAFTDLQSKYNQYGGAPLPAERVHGRGDTDTAAGRPGAPEAGPSATRQDSITQNYRAGRPFGTN